MRTMLRAWQSLVSTTPGPRESDTRPRKGTGAADRKFDSDRRTARPSDEKAEHRSTGFVISPEKLERLLVTSSTASIQRLEVVDNRSRSISHIVETLRTTLRTTQQLAQVAVTIKTANFTLAELAKLAASSPPGACVRSVGVGVWHISVNNGQHITLVQPQLRKAWRRLKLDPTIDRNSGRLRYVRRVAS
ncbi:uncharacterized protein LTR77_006362 [Saxophila tyrrhenica]|uniref:Uncharacterized protein n=1 Tax=Saxophila tyrrhenica TaxID=1690608 RepID=A0AAV9P8H4_9PEZI|nr:hypothetical protein LTR77_006362 [Saxophila tyrrhenica]